MSLALVESTPPPQRTSARAPNRPLAAGRVLVADDEPSVVRQYEESLAEQGYSVRGYTDGRAAMEALRSGSFDALIAGVDMPGLSGFDLLRAAREVDGEMQVVLVADEPSPDLAEHAVRLGALLFLVKPVEPRTFLQVVAHGTRLHRLAHVQRRREELSQHPREPSESLDATFTKALSTIRMAYQPVVRPASRSIFGYEALLRSGTPSLATPGALLSAAEALDRVGDLGRAVRAKVAADIERAPRGAQIFVNLHPDELLDPELTLPGAPLTRHAHRVVLEITERASLEGLRGVPARVQALRAAGFRVAVDDLGAGYAGLSAVAVIVPEFVKIDLSLVRDIHREPLKRELVKHLIAVCAHARISVIAEGVETRSEREALRSVGAELMQGYFFAKPHEAFGPASF